MDNFYISTEVLIKFRNIDELRLYDILVLSMNKDTFEGHFNLIPPRYFYCLKGLKEAGLIQYNKASKKYRVKKSFVSLGTEQNSNKNETHKNTKLE